MPVNKLTWKVGGEAGFGILNAGMMFAKTAMRAGLYSFASAEYPSLIRGGHNHLDVKVSEKAVTSHEKALNVLVALDTLTYNKHRDKVVQDGAIIFDSRTTKIAEKPNAKVLLLDIPLLDIAEKNGGRIMRNTVAIGATMALVDLDLRYFSSVLEDNFGRKGEAVVKGNIQAARAGFDYVRQKNGNNFRFKLKAKTNPGRMLMSGNDAATAGAIKAGCKFLAAYPMTPASSIMSTFAGEERNYSLIMKHTEDEIAAINMSIGASYAGVRSLCATSGGGFSLMTEGFGLAAQTETPLVVIESQRPGPATGMATHSSQGDLLFMMHAGTDEFPRIIVAPGDIEESYYATFDAFNLAEKYQLPVVVLMDKYLSESYATIDSLKTDLKVDRGLMPGKAEDNYRRYRHTPSGVSPRTIPGVKKGMFTASSYEHDEVGYEREEEEIRIAMHDKRFRKFEQAKKDIPGPKLYGPKQAGLTVLCWGSNKGPVLQAMEWLKENNIDVNMLHVQYLNPFPAEAVKKAMQSAKKTVDLENNKTGQFAQLVKLNTGLVMDEAVLKYDGRPFFPEEIYDALKRIADGK